MKLYIFFLILGILLFGFFVCELFNEIFEMFVFSFNLIFFDGEFFIDNDNVVL